MLTVLTIATIFIALVLTIVYWKVVRDMLLWANTIVLLLSLLGLVIAFIVAVVFLFIDFELNSIGNSLRRALVPGLIGLVLLFVGGIAGAIEDWDRNKQWAKFHAYWRNKRQNPND
jgi:hypothetical protein